MRRSLATGVALLLAVALAAAVLGGEWAPFDSLAIVQPYLAALLIALAAPRLLPGGVRIGVLVLALFGAWDVLRHADPGREGDGVALRHLQHNLQQGNRARDLLERLGSVDTATLQEVGAAIHVLADRAADWHLQICPRPGWVTTAAMTRLPVRGSGCTPAGAAWIRLEPPDCFGVDALTLVSVHLFWPWPDEGDRQARQVASLTAEIDALPGPVLLGGDLNQMPWSRAAERLADGVGGRVAGGLHATYTLVDGWLRLPIDHLILGEGLDATTVQGDRHGSDHSSLVAEVQSLSPAGCVAES